MIYTRTGEPKSIDWGATDKAATLQSVDFALVTPIGTNYMARDDGWDIPVGETISTALENEMAGNISNMILDQFEVDGVAVNAVDFKYTNDYELQTVLEVELADDEI